MRSYENKISNILNTTAQVYIILSIISAFIILGLLEGLDSTMKFTLVIIALVHSFLISLIFFGAAEVIELLHKQNKNTEVLIMLQKESRHSTTSILGESEQDNYQNLPDL